MEFDYEKYIPEIIVSLSFVNASNASEFTKAKQYKYLLYVISRVRAYRFGTNFFKRRTQKRANEKGMRAQA